MVWKRISLRLFCAMIGVGTISDTLARDYRLQIDNLQGLGSFQWAHDASNGNPNYGNPTSELTYQEYNSNIVRVSVSTQMPYDRTLGYWMSTGQLLNGNLRDRDWYSEAYAASLSGPTLFSDTSSDLYGGGYFDIGLSISQPLFVLQQGLINWVIEASHIQEQQHAYGAILLADPYGDYSVPVGSELVPNTTNVISQTSSFTSIGFGLEAEWTFWSKWQLSLHTIVRPLVNLQGEDNHHMRADLGRPSVVHRGIGSGIDGAVQMTFLITDQLAAVVGFESSAITLMSGDAVLYASNGNPTQPYPLRAFDYNREQWQMGIQYRFSP